MEMHHKREGWMWSDFLFPFLGFIASHVTQRHIKFSFIGIEKLAQLVEYLPIEFIVIAFAKDKGEEGDRIK